MRRALLLVGLLILSPLLFLNLTAADPNTVTVTISGGHEIPKGDHGRPITLIAPALGVKDEVFREAFAGVTPAKGKPPTGDEARKNKAALLKVLAPHNVTNERLDEVSNYYRFRPQNGELWPVKPAKATATLNNGKLEKITIIDPGSGYSSIPEIKVQGIDAKFKVTLHHDKDLKKNGGIAAIEVVSEK
jgi:hypothetical protein